jgi:hypothetical protein
MKFKVDYSDGKGRIVGSLRLATVNIVLPDALAWALVAPSANESSPRDEEPQQRQPALTRAILPVHIVWIVRIGRRI